ncbi:MAG: BtrH N-terminal domain-containing protein [Solirubrobacterales bacterium]
METDAAPRMVPGYRHRPGHHCGSTALRNLLAHHGVEITEEMALGLGAGVSFYYVPIEGQSPSRFTNGRVGTLEAQFIELTRTPIRLETFEGPDASWEAARATVDSGRSAILLTDLYYLDHYGRSARFPGHAVVLAGYDSEVAYLSDTGFEELQTTRLENLARARHGKHPVFQLEGHMLTVPEGAEIGDVREASARAIERNAQQMLEPPMGEYEGLPALRRFASEVGDWPHELEDWKWCARFCYQVIERRGTGGGNFRLMYSRFLREVSNEHAGLAAEAAAGWTSLAAALLAASESDEPTPSLWFPVRAEAARVLDAEERLWPALAS